MECWSDGEATVETPIKRMGRNIEREEGDKGVVRRSFEGRSEGVFRRLAANKVVLNYTHLHKVPGGNSPPRRRDAEGGKRIGRKRTQRTQTIRNSVDGKRAKVGRKWEKVGCKRAVEPPFPTFSHFHRRKWLISRVCTT